MDINGILSCLALMEWMRLVSGTHPDCWGINYLQKQESDCMLLINEHQEQHLSSSNRTPGCATKWDGVSCWPWALVGETVSVSCPLPLQHLKLPQVLISRNCTSQGWSRLSVSYVTACLHDVDSIEEEDKAKSEYHALVKLMYTVGYGVSLGSLCVAMLIFLTFRSVWFKYFQGTISMRLLCTRTYIHLNLFFSFILRGVAVFIKDAVLFEDKTVDHCTFSTVGCKAAMTFFHYCVLANFFWLLVEGLFLQTLLIFTFANKRTFFWWYTLIGWGMPTVTIMIWTLLRSQYDNQGCWDNLSSLNWIIRIPILISVFGNFLVFLNIIRIIVMKTKTPDSTGGDKPLYRRLAKSTLLLIPLFGVHYIVFALFPDHVGLKARFIFELGLGSYQGFIVALLYCFLNAEVQKEIRKALSECRTQSEGNSFNMVTQNITA